MGRAKNRNIILIVVLLLVAALIGGVGQWEAEGAPQSFSLANFGPLVVEALEAGVVEEVVFRGLLLEGLLALARRCSLRRPEQFALLVSSTLFGLMHLLPDPAAATVPPLDGVVVVQAVLKVLQGTLFGLVMGEMALNSRWSAVEGRRRALALGGPIAVHTSFDLVYLGPLLLAGAGLPETYLTGNPADLVPLAISTLILATAWAISWSTKRKARKTAL